MTKERLVYTAQELAERLGISRKALYTLCWPYSPH